MSDTIKSVSALVGLVGSVFVGLTYFATAQEVDELKAFTQESVAGSRLTEIENKIHDIKFQMRYKREVLGEEPSDIEIQYLESQVQKRNLYMKRLTE